MHHHHRQGPGRSDGQGGGGSTRRLPQEGREGTHHIHGQRNWIDGLIGGLIHRLFYRSIDRLMEGFM